MGNFHELPYVCFSRRFALALGNLVGKFEKVDSDEEGKCWGQSLRARIQIDVTKPLRRGVLIKIGTMADERWIPITYEKLTSMEKLMRDFVWNGGSHRPIGNLVKW